MSRHYDGSPKSFLPARVGGLIFHSVVLLLLIAGSAVGFYFALGAQAGSYSLLALVLAVTAMLPLPFFLYRFYALLRASYILQRNGLTIHWGLRSEDIPLNQIEWLRPVNDLGFSIPRPAFWTPGAILGRRKTDELGMIEYLASENKHALAIATNLSVFVISPADPREFAKTFQRAMELGSLDPIQAKSVQPDRFFGQVLSHHRIRINLIIGLVITMLLFITVTLLIPNLTSANIGFTPGGEGTQASTPVQLLLIPVLAAVCYVADSIGTFFFYQKPVWQPISIILSMTAAVVPALFLISILFLVLS